MFKKIFEKIFGKKNSVQRGLVIDFVIAAIIVILFSILCFYLFVNTSAIEQLVAIKMDTPENVDEFVSIIRRGLLIGIVNILLVGGITMQIASKKMLKPIIQITEATKKVSDGNFNVQLETNRKDEIGELTNNFNKMVKDLEGIELLQKDFIDNVSHEIKTPISSIEGFAKLLKDEDISKEDREDYTNIIIEESERLLNLSGNILKLSKLQNQKIVTNKTIFIPVEQIRKAIVVLEKKWNEKAINFNIEETTNLKDIRIEGEEDSIYGVWLNLIDNAIKASKDRGNIDISIGLKDSFLEVKIKDYGIGMTKEEQSKIFNRFYQADRSHSQNGSGLGLAIVKRVVELSKGEIEVQSEKGNGTTFTVKLPH